MRTGENLIPSTFLALVLGISPAGAQYIPVQPAVAAQYRCASPPTMLNELTALSSENYELTEKQALDVSLIPGKATVAKSRRLAIFDFVKYKDCHPEDTSKVTMVR